jgi:hypothetical protein
MGQIYGKNDDESPIHSTKMSKPLNSMGSLQDYRGGHPEKQV